MKILIGFYLALVFCTSGFAQGSWDLQYRSIQDIDESFIGEEVRLDFKGHRQRKTPGSLSVRRMLISKDTVRLGPDESQQYVEAWKLYPDHGVLREQILLSVGKENDSFIREQFLRDVNDNSVTIEVRLYSVSTGKFKESQLIVVDKAQLNGFLLRELDQ